MSYFVLSNLISAATEVPVSHNLPKTDGLWFSLLHRNNLVSVAKGMK